MTAIRVSQLPDVTVISGTDVLIINDVDVDPVVTSKVRVNDFVTYLNGAIETVITLDTSQIQLVNQESGDTIATKATLTGLPPLSTLTTQEDYNVWLYDVVEEINQHVDEGSGEFLSLEVSGTSNLIGNVTAGANLSVAGTSTLTGLASTPAGFAVTGGDSSTVVNGLYYNTVQSALAVAAAGSDRVRVSATGVEFLVLPSSSEGYNLTGAPTGVVDGIRTANDNSIRLVSNSVDRLIVNSTGNFGFRTNPTPGAAILVGGAYDYNIGSTGKGVEVSSMVSSGTNGSQYGVRAYTGTLSMQANGNIGEYVNYLSRGNVLPTDSSVVTGYSFKANETAALASTTNYAYWTNTVKRVTADPINNPVPTNWAFYSAGDAPSQLGGDLTVSGDLSVAGDLVFTGAISLDDLTLNSLVVNTTSLLKGAVALDTTLSVTGASTLIGGVTAKSTLDVEGASTLNTLAVTSGANVDGSVTVGAGLSVDGASAFKGGATVTGNLVTSGTVQAGYFVGDGSQLTNLPILGPIQFKGEVNVANPPPSPVENGWSYMNTVSGPASAGWAGIADVTVAAQQMVIWSTPYWYLGGTVDSNDYLPITGGTLAGSLAITQNLLVDGVSTFNGATAVNNTLNATGAVEFSDTLLVTGAITGNLSGNATTAGTAANLTRNVLSGNGLVGGGVLTSDVTLSAQAADNTIIVSPAGIAVDPSSIEGVGSAVNATNASNVTVTGNNDDFDYYVILGSSGGYQPLYANSGLKYNASTKLLHGDGSFSIPSATITNFGATGITTQTANVQSTLTAHYITTGTNDSGVSINAPGQIVVNNLNVGQNVDGTSIHASGKIIGNGLDVASGICHGILTTNTLDCGIFTGGRKGLVYKLTAGDGMTFTDQASTHIGGDYDAANPDNYHNSGTIAVGPTVLRTTGSQTLIGDLTVSAPPLGGTGTGTVTAVKFVGDGSELTGLNIPAGFNFKGSIVVTDPAPADPQGGDFYLAAAAGTVDNSFTGIGGTAVNENQILVYSGGASRWFTGASGSSVAPGTYLPLSGGTITGDLGVTGQLTGSVAEFGEVEIPKDGLLWGNKDNINNEGFAIGGNGVAFFYYDRGDVGTANECVWINNVTGGIRLGTAPDQVGNPTINLDTDGTAIFTGQVTIPAIPVSDTHASSKGYVDSQVTGFVTLDTDQSISGIKTFTNNLNVDGNLSIGGAATSVATTDASDASTLTTKSFVLSKIAASGGGTVMEVTSGDGISTTPAGGITETGSIQVDGTVVRTSGDQTLGGVKTFSSAMSTGNITSTGTIEAAFFKGDGSQLTNVPGGNGPFTFLGEVDVVTGAPPTGLSTGDSYLNTVAGLAGGAWTGIDGKSVAMDQLVIWVVPTNGDPAKWMLGSVVDRGTYLPIVGGIITGSLEVNSNLTVGTDLTVRANSNLEGTLSVGAGTNLAGLSVAGNAGFVGTITSANINSTGTIEAAFFKGDGSQLTNLPAGVGSVTLVTGGNGILTSPAGGIESSGSVEVQAADSTISVTANGISVDSAELTGVVFTTGTQAISGSKTFTSDVVGKATEDGSLGNTFTTKDYVLGKIGSAGGGTVTDVTAGLGIIVGDGTGSQDITTTGVLNIDQTTVVTNNNTISIGGVKSFTSDVEGITTLDSSASTVLTSKDYVLAKIAASVPATGVTSVTAGDGLSGGTITDTGTIAVDATVVRTENAQSIGGNKTFTGFDKFTKSIALGTADPDAANLGSIDASGNITASAFIGDGSQLTGLDIPPAFNFKGTVDVGAAAPVDPQGGDFYLAAAAGTVNNSFTGIGGIAVNENQILVYSGGASRWFTGASGQSVAPGTYLPMTGGTITGDLGVTGVLGVDGIVTFGSDLNVTGNLTGGTYNGLSVGTGGGDIAFNTAVGDSTLENNTTGSDNTAVGHSALSLNTEGSENTAVGLNALYSNTTGNHSTAVGENALYNNNGNNNTAVGRQALYENTTGTNSTAVGRSALQDNTEGVNNVAVGLSALERNTTGGNNTSVGRSALQYSIAATNNSAFGFNALYLNTEGNENVAVGTESLENNLSGNQNVGLGVGALNTNTTGSGNVALGYQAGYYIESNNNTILGGYVGTAADSTLSDTVIVSAGATERLRINSSGNVLIGNSAATPNITLASDGSASFATGKVTIDTSGGASFDSVVRTDLTAASVTGDYTGFFSGYAATQGAVTGENYAFFASDSAAQISPTLNAAFVSDLSAQGSGATSYAFYGKGDAPSWLKGKFTVGGNSAAAPSITLEANGNIIFTGVITGDGSGLTNVDGGGGGGTVISVTSGDGITTNPGAGITSAGSVSVDSTVLRNSGTQSITGSLTATGNITTSGGFFIGDGSQLTNLPTQTQGTVTQVDAGNGLESDPSGGIVGSGSLTVVAADTTINVGPTGISVVEANLSSVPNADSATDATNAEYVKIDATVSDADYMIPFAAGTGNRLLYSSEGITYNPSTENLTVDGTVSATSFVGDGSQLTNLPFPTRAFNFRGEVNVVDNDPPNTPQSGDVYMNTKTGTAKSTWTGIAGDTIYIDQIVIFMVSTAGGDGSWFAGNIIDRGIYVPTAGGTITGNLTVQGITNLQNTTNVNGTLNATSLTGDGSGITNLNAVTQVSAGDGLASTPGGGITSTGSLAVDSSVIRTSGNQTITGTTTLVGDNINTGTFKVTSTSRLENNVTVLGSVNATSFVGDGSQLTNLPNTGANVSTGEDPPTSPAIGDMWWDSSAADAQLYVYFDSTWVAASPVAAPDHIDEFKLTTNTAFAAIKAAVSDPNTDLAGMKAAILSALASF